MIVDNCIFCKILADEIPSSVVYEDDMFRAILDVNPAAKGHVIKTSQSNSDKVSIGMFG